MIEVATFLLDLDRITEPALQRIASIALRQINNGSNYSISHDQLVRRIRSLNIDDQDLFLEELKRLLVNMLSVMTAVPQQQQPTVNPTKPDGDESGLCANIVPPLIIEPSIANGAVMADACGAESVVHDQAKADENEDLAEADQRCCLDDDGAHQALDGVS